MTRRRRPRLVAMLPMVRVYRDAVRDWRRAGSARRERLYCRFVTIYESLTPREKRQVTELFYSSLLKDAK